MAGKIYKECGNKVKFSLANDDNYSIMEE